MWHEARRSERKVHDMMDAARKRAQRRAVFLAKRRGDPQQSIQVVGSRCRLYRDDGLYQATEDQQGLYVSELNFDPKFNQKWNLLYVYEFMNMPLRSNFVCFRIPWNGKQDVLIDR